jgi:sugar phosphate permease
VSGIVNGIASLSVIAMSAQTSNIVLHLGWSGLFVLLSVLSGSAALVSYPAVRIEKNYFKELSDTDINMKYNKEIKEERNIV